jgi:hypothetical protein
MKLLSVTPSQKPEKKLDATFQTDTGRTKTVSFGAKGMEDYTKTHDKAQRERYLNRHKKNENWSKPDSAGALSRWILWGGSTSLMKNISDYKNKVNS